MPDLLTMLKKDHREVEQLLDRLEETEEGSERSQLLEQLTAALALHMEIEESLVYPHLAEVVGDEPDEEAHTEHDLARTGLQQLQQLQGAPGFGAAVAMLRGGIQHHVHEEERELLPALKSGLDRDTYRQVCDEVAAAKEQQEAARGRSRSSGKKATASRRSPSSTTAKRTSGSRKPASGSRKQGSRSTRSRSSS